MITKTCDRCERLIEVDDDYAGQKVECPMCGDVNLMPKAKGEETPAGPRARESRGEERRLLKVHQAMFRAKPILCSILFLVLIGGVVGVVYWWLIAPKIWLAWIVGIFALLVAGVLAFWKIKTIDESLEITTERSILRVGLFSRRTSEVQHNAIRNVSIQQTFWNRIWNVGQLSISSAGQDGFEIVIKDLASPKRVRDAIETARDQDD